MTDLPLEVSNFFLAMQAGKVAADALAACFDEDAIYEEPFSGVINRHVGKPAIMQAMAAGWDFPMPDRHIVIERVVAGSDEILVEWTCYASVLPGGRGSGTNRFQLRDGRITHLTTTLNSGPDNVEKS